MRSFEKQNRLMITKELILGKNATLKVADSATGVLSDVSLSELAVLDGLTATAAELNKSADVSGRVVNTTATTLAITAALHGGRIVTVNSAAPIAITLPAATGSGEVFRFIIGTAATATAHTIKVANTTDVMAGVAIAQATTTNEVAGFATTATDDSISINGTTKGGSVGDRIEIIDAKSGVYTVQMIARMTGSIATPFSASV